MKKLLFASALLALLSGCMKFEEYKLNSQINGCKISTMYLYGPATGTLSDTARFTWTGNDITRVSLSSMHYDLAYSGNVVVGRTFYSGAAAQPFQYDQFGYNPSLQLTRFARFEKDMNGAFYQSDSTALQYSGSMLTGFSQWTSSGGAAPLVLSRRREYSYTGGNLSEVREIEYRNGAAVDTTRTSLQTNNDPNWFLSINPRFWAAGPLSAFGDIDALEQTQLQHALERQTTGGLPTIYSYSLDDKGNLAEHKVNGQVAARYFYNCP
ncbi:hypothetical protein EPD60_05155 [Flaviaesturariibacter flavus]|uniref:DUF4595 domain-containing protein n=1 Tax=Flaviaesturariibacter flavus TaxID=2502780 RepID=A0A4R1BJU3_9BACT|nr:hypothetical protein [Flaviaesturariibacter flavus]TCJ17583.1 hypothetical protein EPD60_05155 [Flaviaesturariibacter flavus]